MGFNGRSDGGESSLVEVWRWKGDEEEFGDMIWLRIWESPIVGFHDRKLTGYIEVIGLINAIDLPLLVLLQLISRCTIGKRMDEDEHFFQPNGVLSTSLVNSAIS